MARYDRLAPLPLPERNACFAGWAALRDLAGRERDAELGRRLRLHFLVLRPITRRAREGAAADAASLAAQIERVREELGTLAARDPQRVVVAQALTGLLDPSLEATARVTVSLGERALEWGHHSAAQEYGELAAELIRHASPGLLAAALGLAARAAAAGGRNSEAAALSASAVQCAEQQGDAMPLVAALATMAAITGRSDAVEEALAKLGRIEASRVAAGDSAAATAAAEAAARITLRTGSPSAAADHALRALGSAGTARQRVRILELVGEALLALGRPDAAEHAWALAQSGADGSERVRLLARRARCRAQSGDETGFRELTKQLPATGLPAPARIELAAASLALADIDAARRFAQAAYQSARSSLHRESLHAASVLLDEIDRSANTLLAVPVATQAGDPGADVIFERLLALGGAPTRS